MSKIDIVSKMKESIQSRVIISEYTLDNIINCLLCEGHVLLEDMPGTGKTTLAKAMAVMMDASFRRIQFVPDMLPSDLTGINYYNQKQGEFVFRPGPLFANVILADEINRATPRTQSALLECMEERQVSVDNTTYKLERPVVGIATQNPIETGGTFPLPEAQLDRFFMKLSLNYPTADMEVNIVKLNLGAPAISTANPCVCTLADITGLIQHVKEITIDESILRYIQSIVARTRSSSYIKVGVSPRGTIALAQSARARALQQGREYVLPDDVKAQAVSVLPHRIICDFHRRASAQDSTEIIRDIILSTDAPIA